ncbi:hypothetical protein GXW77_18185, partial [Roseomonas alkaliterrae]|nr:hypothetical protein [Neoroseomonas alkaliterrae]
MTEKALHDIARRLGVVMQGMIADDTSDPGSDLRIRLAERVTTLADIIAALRGAANGLDETAGAAAAQKRTTMPIGTPRAANRPASENAGTPAPPIFHAPSLTAEESQPAHAQAAPRRTGRPAEVWVTERDALLRERFPTQTDDAALLAALNAIPAPWPVASTTALRRRACLLGIRRAPALVLELMSRNGRASAEARREKGLGPMKWTAQRVALLRADYPDCTDLPALLARVNALPGDPIASVDALRKKAESLGIVREAEAARAARGRRRKNVAVEPPAAAEETTEPDAPPPQPAATTRRPAKA